MRGARTGQWKRRAAAWVSLLAVVVVAAGCDSRLPPLELEAVRPDIGGEGLATPITLVGAFYAPVATDLGTGRGTLIEGFAAWVGETPLEQVRLLSDGELEALVPRGVAAGLYSVEVEDPLGRRAVLAEAFRVVSVDGVGPEVEILEPQLGERVPAGGAFLVRYRATERQPGRVAAVDFNVVVGHTDEHHQEPPEPVSIMEGHFEVAVPYFTEERVVGVDIVAWDDAPTPNPGGARVEVIIDNCGEDRDCDDGQHCTGRELCDDGWCLPGEEVVCVDSFECTLDLCDEAEDLCVHLPRPELCDDGLACSGEETCTVEAGCVAGALPCDDGLDCTVDRCDEATLDCTHSPLDEGCQDGLFCNGAEVCDVRAGCRPGAPPCQDDIECTADKCNEASRSCSHMPSAASCNDSDPCTVERCDLWEGCLSSGADEGPVGDPSCRDGLDSDCDLLADGADPGCAEPPCMGVLVRPDGPGRSTIEVDLCEPGRDPALIHCESHRNEPVLSSWDFEEGTEGLSLVGDVARSPVAQAFLRPGSMGLRICRDGSMVEAAVDTRGRRGLALRLAAASESLGDGEYLEVRFSPDGGISDWHTLLVLGDGTASPSRRRLLLLPAEAEGQPDLRIRAEVTGRDGCGVVDDSAVVDLPAREAVRDLVVEGFEHGFGDLMVLDPSGLDVSSVPSGAGTLAQVATGTGAWVAAFVRAPLAGSEEALVVSLELGALGLGADDYGLVQYSLDRGESWVDVLGTGLGRPVAALSLGWIVDPTEGAPEELQVRLLGPTAAAGGGFLQVDDLTIRAVDPAFTDEIGPFADVGDGIYRATLETASPGSAELRCVYQTPGYALWSAPVAASL